MMILHRDEEVEHFGPLKMRIDAGKFVLEATTENRCKNVIPVDVQCKDTQPSLYFKSYTLKHSHPHQW